MKTQTINLYSPSDLVKLLATTTMSLRHIAEETDIPFPTLRNYRYDKTDADSMPYKMVARLSEFFLSQNYDTIDAFTTDLMCVDDDEQLLTRFGVQGEYLDLYTLHEIMVRFYADDDTKYDDVIIYLSPKAYEYLNRAMVNVGHPATLYLQRAVQKGCHIIYPKELSDKLSDVEGSRVTVKNGDVIQLSTDGKVGYIIGNKLLEPSRMSVITTPNIAYYVEVILGLNTEFIEKLYKECGTPKEKSVILFLTESHTLMSEKWGYGVDRYVLDIYREIQERLLKTNIYVNLLAGRYENPLTGHEYTTPSNPCGPRNSLNPRQNIRLYDVDEVVVDTINNGIDKIENLIRPVDFDWRELITSWEIDKHKPIEVCINLELGISVIKSISFYTKSGDYVFYLP